MQNTDPNERATLGADDEAVMADVDALTRQLDSTRRSSPRCAK